MFARLLYSIKVSQEIQPTLKEAVNFYFLEGDVSTHIIWNSVGRFCLHLFIQSFMDLCILSSYFLNFILAALGLCSVQDLPCGMRAS